MKFLFSILTVVTLLLAAAPAKAQMYSGENYIMTGGTNNIAGNVNAGTSVINWYTNGSYTIDARYFENVGVALTATGIQATNVAIKAYFDQALTEPATTYNPATNQFVLQLIVQGTNTMTAPTNFYVGAIGYLKLTKIENLSSNAVTNITITYSTKPRR